MQTKQMRVTDRYTLNPVTWARASAGAYTTIAIYNDIWRVKLTKINQVLQWQDVLYKVVSVEIMQHVRDTDKWYDIKLHYATWKTAVTLSR